MNYVEKILCFEGSSIAEVSKTLTMEEVQEMACLASDSLYYSVDLYDYCEKDFLNEAEKEEITHFFILSLFVEQIAEGIRVGTFKLFEYLYNYI